MLCCGKKKKYDVKCNEVARDNCGFVGEDDVDREMRNSAQVGVGRTLAVEVTVKSPQNRSEEENGNEEKTYPLEKLKGILIIPDKKYEETTEQARKRTHTVSFSLPEDDLLIEHDHQLNAVLEVADRLKLEETMKENRYTELKNCKGEEETLNMSNRVPAIGKPAPVFKGTAVVSGEFKEISLEDYNGKYVVFFFYPLDFTFVCPTEIIAFSDRVEEFRNIGCEVVACSTDSHFSHLAWTNTPRKEGGLGEMNIPLLADKSMEIAKMYGVLKEDEGLAFRGLFIIDGKQNLRQVTINDLPVGRDVDETLRLVQAFQFVDEHGEVCPAGWKPGSKTMKADPVGSKEYFEAKN